jgi:hypothetical protein
MSTYRSQAGQSRLARSAQTRAQRAQRFWTWFWCLVAAVFLLVSLGLAHSVATLLVSGFFGRP